MRTILFRTLKTTSCILISFLLLGCSFNDRTLDSNVDNDIKSGTWNGSNKLESPLQSAVFHSNLKYLKRLLEEGHDIAFVDSQHKNLLHIAAKYSDLPMNMFLIQNGVDLNKEDIQSWTPLNYACRYDREEIVKLYVDNGVNFKNLADNPINNALTGANEGLTEIIRILADKGFDLNDPTSDPVHRAIAYDMVGAVKLMIEKGANHKRVSDNGWNYLHWCGYYGANDCAKYLNQFDDLRTPTTLSYQAPENGNSDTTIVYPGNLSAMDIARINHHMETVKFLE